MDNGGDKKSKGPDDFYHVLGVDKECTATELRIAYKKLALRWHPDRCSASGNSKFVEEAKNKFQAIQQAYSVLSDDNKRFLYDVGVYDSDDDENGMGDFLNEMAVMMSQTKPSGNGEDSFEQLQELFVEMFQEDIGSLGSNRVGTSSYSTSSSYYSFCHSSNSNNLQTATSSGSSGSDSRFQKFCPGVAAHHQSFKKGKRARRREQGATDRRSSSRIREEMASSWL